MIDNTALNFGLGLEVVGAAVQISEAAVEDQDDHAMNLYEIGRFLEFNFLSLSCEDLLMQRLVSCPGILVEYVYSVCR